MAMFPSFKHDTGAARSATDGEVSGVRPLALTRTVIVSDPNARNRDAIATALRQRGFVVVEAADGIDLARRLHTLLARTWPGVGCDLVIASLDSVTANGIDVLHGLRSCGLELPVIVTTATATALKREAAQALGAVDLLSSPLDLHALETALEAMTGIVWRAVHGS